MDHEGHDRVTKVRDNIAHAVRLRQHASDARWHDSSRHGIENLLGEIADV
jgi:hypothetical protein